MNEGQKERYKHPSKPGYVTFLLLSYWEDRLHDNCVFPGVLVYWCAREHETAAKHVVEKARAFTFPRC